MPENWISSPERFEEEEEDQQKQQKLKGWKYELGRTLGEGNFGKVKYATHLESGRAFAVKILDKQRIIALKIDGQIKREIRTLKMMKHPHVVRLHEVSASRTKIYMVLEYVNGGELFDKIASRGKLSEQEGRRLFQQLIDGLSYCHSKGVYHRDLKPENILVDCKGNVKISDFGLSALSQHLGNDGLLHTTCGSPNYIAPEILTKRGYDGAASDIWSCGVILYVILTGHLPFDDRNLAVLYHKISKGETQFPKWLSPGATKLIRRILDPNPKKRPTVDEIRADDWFKKDYIPALPDEDDEDPHFDFDEFSLKEAAALGQREGVPSFINAFALIGMSSSLDLSGFFEKEDVSERKIRFTSSYSSKCVLERIESVVTEIGFQVRRRGGMLKITQPGEGSKTNANLSVAAEVFEVSPSLYVVELRKSSGDSSSYRYLCAKLAEELGKAQPQIADFAVPAAPLTIPLVE